jgi:hypothetical protein
MLEVTESTLSGNTKGKVAYPESGNGRKRVARRAARPVGMVKGAFLESQLPVA